LVSHPHSTDFLLKSTGAVTILDHISDRMIKFCKYVTLLHAVLNNLRSSMY